MNPWADPRTETEPGLPYAGPPPTAPPGAGPPYGAPSYGAPAYGWPPYGYPSYGYPYGYPPPWPVPPRGPRRPGQVIAAAVLAFVQAALVLGASAYVLLVVSVLGYAASEGGSGASASIRAIATEAHVLIVIQLVSAVLLIVTGILALNRRGSVTWWLLLAAFGLQLLLAVYWGVRLTTALSGASDPDPTGTFVGLSLFFAAPPVVGLGLVLFGPGRRWLAVPRAAGTGGAQPG